MVPGAFTSGTNHFDNASHPADERWPRRTSSATRVDGRRQRKLAELRRRTPTPVRWRQIVRVVDMPKGKRPFRIYVDPADDGAEDVFRVGDRIRQWFYQRIGYSDLLSVGRPETPK